MLNKRKLLILSCFIFLSAVGCSGKGVSSPASPEKIAPKLIDTSIPYSWVKDTKIIAHGFGSIDDKRVTNSLEAFNQNYKDGIRVFEVDLVLTSDDKLVARHDWEAYLSKEFQQNIPKEKLDKPLSLSEFKSYKIYGKYTPLSFEDIAVLMRRYKDIYIVTDTKDDNPSTPQVDINFDEVTRKFSKIRDIANSVDPEILNRIIPQIYVEEMYPAVTKAYPFKNVIYTLYISGSSDKRVVEFAKGNNIKVITAPTERVKKEFTDLLKASDIKLYTHTINTKDELSKYTSLGVNGVYSDFLKP